MPRRSPVVVVTFKAEYWVVELLTSFAKAQGKSRSEVIREAIMCWLRKNGVDVQPVAGIGDEEEDVEYRYIVVKV